MTITTDAEPAPPLLAVRGKPVRLPWNRRVWAAVTFVFAGLALLGQFVIVPTTTPALRMGTTTGWAYPQDRHAVTATRAVNAEQDTVPIRSGQRQGILFTVYNPSDHAQRVLRLAQPALATTLSDSRLEVATTAGAHGGPGSPDVVSYSAQASIPPHRERWVRLTWVSTTCLEAGDWIGLSIVPLRVRVGAITRTETITFHQTFALAGPSDPAACAG